MRNLPTFSTNSKQKMKQSTEDHREPMAWAATVALSHRVGLGRMVWWLALSSVRAEQRLALPHCGLLGFWAALFLGLPVWSWSPGRGQGHSLLCRTADPTRPKL